ncbi:hypothetical protein D3C73_813710 [compost metagenome]
MFFARPPVADDDLRQAVLALQPDQMARIGHVRDDQPARFMGHDGLPVLLAGSGNRCLDDLEILGVAIIGHDVENVAALGHRIFDALFALRHQLRLRSQIGSRDQPVFGRLVVVDVDIDEVVEQRASDTHEEAWISLLEHQPIGRLRLTDDMVEDFRRAMVLVLQRVEEALAIGRPHAVASSVLDQVIEVHAGFKIADAQGEIFRPLVVITPDAVAMIGRVVHAGQPEIILARRFLVTVEKRLLVAAVTRRAEIMRLLAAGHEQGTIGVRSVLRRHRTVVFLDAAAHFGKQRFLQLFRIAECCFHIAVFGFQMLADFRVEDRRILEHRLPVVGPQPGIIVRTGNSVTRVADRLLGRYRRCREIGERRFRGGGQGSTPV